MHLICKLKKAVVDSNGLARFRVNRGVLLLQVTSSGVSKRSGIIGRVLHTRTKRHFTKRLIKSRTVEPILKSRVQLSTIYFLILNYFVQFKIQNDTVSISSVLAIN